MHYYWFQSKPYSLLEPLALILCKFRCPISHSRHILKAEILTGTEELQLRTHSCHIRLYLSAYRQHTSFLVLSFIFTLIDYQLPNSWQLEKELLCSRLLRGCAYILYAQTSALVRHSWKWIVTRQRISPSSPMWRLVVYPRKKKYICTLKEGKIDLTGIKLLHRTIKQTAVPWI